MLLFFALTAGTCLACPLCRLLRTGGVGVASLCSLFCAFFFVCRFVYRLVVARLGVACGTSLGGTVRSGRTDKTVLIIADQIGSSRTCQCLAYKVGILWAIKLQKRALQLLFVVIGSNVDLLHVQGIDACVVHDGGGGSGRGVVTW